MCEVEHAEVEVVMFNFPLMRGSERKQERERRERETVENIWKTHKIMWSKPAETLLDVTAGKHKDELKYTTVGC